ncbi:hypothetical protein AUJ77_00290 [Candidatus Nomurabacteria bacterium CG1_02_43_90]|uniref:Chloramphenicol acetyltransferase n=1 Tax=Candidatus Nomurabacteria bacterium CG1_02_43_90 TaxID=1805281 RepID=A0A1J4V5F0_9BACT|nr:MAG: hypothetical protein AUJ77_00290 [Candidatus Nomurabacteria bacterium CG1_02_43_90]
MNPIASFFAKVFIYFWYKKGEYFFWRSKKYVTNWGEGTYGTPYLISYDKRSTLSVGAYCSIASRVSILLGANHLFGRITTYPLSLINEDMTVTDASEPGSVVIGNDVWVGYGPTIIGPVSVGDGAIIAAGTDEVHAKIIKYRLPEDQINDMVAIAWWGWGRDSIKKREKDIYSKDFNKFIKKYKNEAGE